MRNKNKHSRGFTLIELLVVIAIIALLSSLAMVSYLSARQKSRDAKRVSDMVQMNNALELYFSSTKGYPSGPSGIPSPLVPTALLALPNAPQPPDGGCEAIDYHAFNANIANGTFATGYYYYPSGTAFIGSNGGTVYPDFEYHFCLGNVTGNLSAGAHVLTPRGLR